MLTYIRACVAYMETLGHSQNTWTAVESPLRIKPHSVHAIDLFWRIHTITPLSPASEVQFPPSL